MLLGIPLFFLAAAGPALALEIPAPTGKYVNDFADVMEAADEQQLEGFLSDLDRQTSNQIVVVTLPSLDGSTSEQVTLGIAEKWKPGVKGRDNGVVVGVYPNDKQARIEVGYGLEGAIPDAVASSILRNDMIPLFQQGAWAQGIAAGVRSLASAAAGEYKIPRQAQRKPGGVGLLFLLLVFGVPFLILSRLMGRRGFGSYGPGGFHRGGWGGGGFGGRGGGGGFGGFGGGGGGFGGGGASGRW